MVLAVELRRLLSINRIIVLYSFVIECLNRNSSRATMIKF